MEFILILFLILIFCVLLIIAQFVNNYKKISNDAVMVLLMLFAMGFIWVLYKWSLSSILVEVTFTTVHFVFYLPLIICLTVCVFSFIFFVHYFCGDRFTAEELIIILISLLLGIFAISSYDLISLYVVIEGLNLCSFVLIVSTDKTVRSLYAALKYIVITLFSSLLFLLAIWCILFEWGTFILPLQRYVILSQTPTPIGICGIFLLVLTFCIKLGMVPVYAWLLDVYRNSSVKTLCFLTVNIKTVFTIVFINIFHQIYLIPYVSEIVFVIGVASLFVGNLLLLREVKVRGFVAVLSLISTGFLFLGLGEFNYTILCFYIIVQAMNILFFLSLLCVFLHPDTLPVSFSTYRNYLELSGLLYIFHMLCLFAIIGIPPFAGFFPKILMIYNLYLNQMYISVLLFILFTVFMGFGVIRILRYFSITSETEFLSPALSHSKPLLGFMVLCVIFILFNLTCVQIVLFLLVM